MAMVAGLHALLLGWLFAHRPHTDVVLKPAPAISTRWLAAPASAGEPQRPAPSVPARVTVKRESREPRELREPRAAAPVEDTAVLPSDPLPSAGVLPAVPEPALRADSIQRAARESVRRKGLAELADEQLGPPPVDAQAALRKGMASAARSDCLKGGDSGYAHQGMGLFALPLLAADAITGRCR